MKLFFKLLISEHKYGITIKVAEKTGNGKEVMRLLDSEIKPVEYHPAIRLLNDDQRNLLFFLVNALVYKETMSRLELKEGTLKQWRAELYSTLNIKKAVLLSKLAAEQHWFICQQV
jgi:hypothetical protein